MKDHLIKIFRKSLLTFPDISFPLYIKWQQHALKQLNLERGIICFSFDNDYLADNNAAMSILPTLKLFDVKVTWAVVGLWMQKNHLLHEMMLKDGHELMNHSWSHPDNNELRPGDVRKFNQISDQEVEDEICATHEFCMKEFNYRMVGFRMPHFRKHPAVRGVLKKLNYEYTSNHISLMAPTLGTPYLTNEGWVELPLSGIPRSPGRIHETYRLFRRPDGLYRDDNQFYEDFLSMLYYTEKYKLISVVYFDACDIVKLTNPAFERYLNDVRNRSIDVMTYREVAHLIDKGFRK